MIRIYDKHMFNADISNAHYTWYQIEIFEATIYTTSTTFFAVKSAHFTRGLSANHRDKKKSHITPSLLT